MIHLVRMSCCEISFKPHLPFCISVFVSAVCPTHWVVETDIWMFMFSILIGDRVTEKEDVREENKSRSAHLRNIFVSKRSLNLQTALKIHRTYLEKFAINKDHLYGQTLYSEEGQYRITKT